MSSTGSTVSIIVAILNEKYTLGWLLDSIKAQTWPQIEVIIIDGGSIDGTLEIIQDRLQDIAYWHSAADSGIYQAWNKALSQASGDYICFMGADDVWAEPDSVQQLMSMTDDRPDLIASKFKMYWPPSNQFIESGSEWSWQDMVQRMNVSHRGLLHNRRLFSEFGNFDESYQIAGDYEFLLRCGKKLTTVYHDQVTVIAGANGVSITRPFESLWERYRAQRQHKPISWANSIRLFLTEYTVIKAGKLKIKLKSLIR